ncbi:mechanosensitive ion channel domain-containing protein [Hirsutella rhossiliensis]|uniref:Mechanosensitive ion channel protein n=1 Tax=Hirsutella rhossiliensis TaxID=111463 RepID=A0A9P8SM49_9HYPO|nr:mechanosensitive ion channel domain-containing protein [Hirsutella rhossiliensis]KAH0966964.1 mechanosensitive ion channel domain-containing protein [Hirsutella rhossiliensis]
MSSKRHSLNSRSSGFIPLSGGGAKDMADVGIPLSNVRSNVSTTGARKPNPGASTSYDSSPTEKSGLHHRHAGRRRKFGEGLGRTGTGNSDDVSVNALGRIYAKIVGFSVVTRYMVYVIPVGILLAVPLIVLSLTEHRYDLPVGSKRGENGEPEKPGPSLFSLFLWILISWLSLWAAKIAAWFLPKVFMFFCGIVSMGVRKYATVLQNLTISLSLFFSALASWMTFKHLFEAANKDGINWVVDLQRILAALFASSAVLLAEKAIVQLIGVSYHQRSFANRIKASKREIYLLGLLYDASRTLFPMYCPEFAEEDYVINDSIEMMLRGKKAKAGKAAGAATPMKIIGDVGRFGDKVTSAVGNIAHEITGKQVLNPNSAHSIVLEALEKRAPSEALGRRIWMSFVLEGKEALYIDDFQEVLGPPYRDEAEEAFNAIDSDLNGDISLEEMMRKVVEVGKERKAIGEGMKDIGQALRVFDKVLLFVVLLIVIFIFLFFFNSSYIQVIASAGTALLSLSFVFATTTQEFLGSCIFLFVKHPYDVGDRVDIGKVQMVVDRISLLYTVFTRIDLMQVVQVPNIQLNNLWVDNISRSKAMKETVELNVSFDTTFEDIELLRLEMEDFVRSPDNARDFQPDFNISVAGIGALDKMVLYISIKHKSNWHNDGVRAVRRSKFMCALTMALKKIPIYGPGGGSEELGGPTNPSYSVAVSNDFAATARNEASKKKDESRMVPTNADQTEEEARANEQHAATEINTRHLVVETESLWSPRENEDRSATPRDMDDHRRSRDIESVRTELIKRASTRGRRKAGEGLRNLTPTESGYAGSAPHAVSSRLETFDEEAQTGMSSPYRGGQTGLEVAEEERLGLYQSASQRSQPGRHRGPSFSFKDSRGLTPGHR